MEGDIDGAYNYVQHDTMVSILSEKITDKKFLVLIKQLHKSGIMENNVTKETTLKIPQGGIASPILFNIYMHKFDEYVANYCSNVLEKENEFRQLRNSKRYRQVERKFNNINLRNDTIFRRASAPSRVLL